MFQKYQTPRRDLLQRQVLQAFNVNVPTLGTPVQLPPFRILPGMEAVAKKGPANTAAIYLARFPRPRAAANTPAGDAITIVSSSEDQVNLGGDMLSQWFVDSDANNNAVQVIIYMNRGEQFV